MIFINTFSKSHLVPFVIPKRGLCALLIVNQFVFVPLANRTWSILARSILAAQVRR